jgi:hypothetical protein
MTADLTLQRIIENEKLRNELDSVFRQLETTPEGALSTYKAAKEFNLPIDCYITQFLAKHKDHILNQLNAKH